MPLVYNGTSIKTLNYNGTEVRTLIQNGTTVYVKTYLAFDENGGNAVTDKYVYYQETYGTLPTPTRTNFTFNGWWTGLSTGTQVLSTTTVTTTSTSQTLFARWISAGPTVWTYIGTSGGYNSTATRVYPSSTFCGNSTVQINEARQALPSVSNYSSGHIIRVTVYTANFQFCSYRYFRAD